MYFFSGRLARLLLLTPLMALLSCGGGGDPEMTLDGSDPVDTIASLDVTYPDISDQKARIESFRVAGATPSVYVRLHRPETCTSSSPCPALVLVPPLGTPGTEEFPTDLCSSLALVSGTIVATFNPPGTGVPSQRTEGAIDWGGAADQDALKNALDQLQDRSDVDTSQVGVVSFGSGLSTGAGALARFSKTTLFFVGWLIDIEGPTNRCYMTQAPYTLDAGGDHINKDGPGVSTTRCDFDLFPRTDKFPAGTSSDGKGTGGTPNSYICNENHPLLKETGRTCDDDAWWKEREPKFYLQTLPVHYLRMQFLHDHNQPTRYAAREALRWLAKGGESASYQINSLQKNKNLAGYSEAQLVQSGVYLDVSGVGNGLGSDIFDTEGSFVKVSQEELFTLILPKYIERMNKRVR